MHLVLHIPALQESSVFCNLGNVRWCGRKPLERGTGRSRNRRARRGRRQRARQVPSAASCVLAICTPNGVSLAKKHGACAAFANRLAITHQDVTLCLLLLIIHDCHIYWLLHLFLLFGSRSHLWCAHIIALKSVPWKD